MAKLDSTIIYGDLTLNTSNVNKILVGNGLSPVLSPTSLHWDNVNNRLGIGSATPSTTLDVLGNGNISGLLTTGNISTTGALTASRVSTTNLTTTNLIATSLTASTIGVGTVSVTGTMSANAIVRTGGVSTQFLKADGSVDSNTYLTTGSASGTYLPLTGGTLSGTLTATSFIRTGGASTQFLKADGSIDSNTYLTTGSASGTYLPLSGGTLTGPLTTQDITISGTLLVNGTTSTVNSTTVTVKDPIITLGGNTAPTSNDMKDRGVEFRYYEGVAKVGFFGRDDSDGRFKYFTDATNTAEVFSGILGTAEFGTVIATTFSATSLTVSNIIPLGSTATTFLTHTAGLVQSRTSTQVLSDIGAQAALTNPTTGTGSVNFISKFTGSTTIGNSQIFDNGTNVGIGTITPTKKLDVSGDILVNSILIGKGNNSLSNNTVIGIQSGNNITTGNFNTFVGFCSGSFVTNGHSNMFSGNKSGFSTTTGTDNTFSGFESGLLNTVGILNTFLGAEAGRGNTVGNTNTGVGAQSGYFQSFGIDNVYLGSRAGTFISATGSDPMTDSNSSIFIGSNSRALGNTQSNQIVIGNYSIGLGSNTTVLGNPSTLFTAIHGNLLLGQTTNNGIDKLQVTGSVLASSYKVIGGTSSQFLKADGSLDSTTYAKEDGTILYHSVRWFTPTGNVSSNGVTVTSVDAQFTSGMVGSKLTISGESRIITGYTSTTVVTVSSAYSQNYTNITSGSWGVHSKSYETTSSGVITIYSEVGGTAIRKRSGDTNVHIPALLDISNLYYLNNGNFQLHNNFKFTFSGSSVYTGTKDVGIGRNSLGVLEIYDGITPGVYRDLNLRNLVASGTITASISALGTTASTFLTHTGGLVQSRTSAQVLTDIGAQAALTNPNTGTGSVNFISKFTGTTTIGNSQIFDNGTNVGIGTTTPTDRLDVSGNIRLVNVSDYLKFGNDLVSVRRLANRLQLHSFNGFELIDSQFSSTRLFIASNGNTVLGVDGTVTPGSRLVVKGSGSTSATSAMNVTNSVDNSLLFVGDDGNIGIGTTSPSVRMHLLRSTNGGLLRLQDSTNVNQDYVFETEQNGVFYGLSIKNNATGGVIANFDGRQFLGIGTDNPNVPLEISQQGADALQVRIGGFFGIGHTTSGQMRSVIGSSYGAATTMMSFTLGGYTTASDKMTILGSGNVGIGTTTPSEKLNVVGNSLISGTMTATTIVKSGGLSSEFLKADGSVDSNSYLTTASASSIYLTSASASGTYLPLSGGTLTGPLTTTDITISGTLLVNGTTSTVNSTTVTVKDPIITLGGNTAPTSNDAKDRGVEFRYFDSTARVGFFGMDDTDKRFKYFINATNTSEVFSGTLGDAEFGGVIGTILYIGTTTGSSRVNIKGSGNTVSTSPLSIENSNNNSLFKISDNGLILIGSTSVPGVIRFDNTSGTNNLLDLNNNNIVGVNNLVISDPGPGEGIEWANGNNWKIYESPNDLVSNNSGNLQFVQGSTRRGTFNTLGQLELPVVTGTAPLLLSSTTLVINLNADKLDGADLSTNTTLGTSDVLIPSQNAVKTYADTKFPITGGNITGSVSVSGTFSASIPILSTTASLFVTHTNGLLQSRTSAQVLSDIGAQATLTNPTTGTGSVNFITKWSGSTTQTNSQIFDDGANIGVGTTVPTVKLDVFGNIRNYNSGTTRSINITDGTTISGSNHLVLSASTSYLTLSATNNFIYSDSGSGHLFRNGTGLTEWARITNTGNFGIGTASPTEKLHVVGNSLISGTMTASVIARSGGTSTQFLKADGSIDSNTYLTSASASSTYLPLTGGSITGNLGVTGTFSASIPALGATATTFLTHTNGLIQSRTNAQVLSDINAQSTLVSGVNIKTINGFSVLGTGNLSTGIDSVIMDSFVWTSGTQSFTTSQLLTSLISVVVQTTNLHPSQYSVNGNTITILDELDINDNITITYNTNTSTIGIVNVSFLQDALDSKSNIGHTHSLTSIVNPGGAVGDIIKWNGTSWIRVPRGSANQVLKVNTGGSDIEWGVDNNTTYDISSVTTTGGAFLRLTGSNPSTTKDVKFNGGTGVTITQATDVITLSIGQDVSTSSNVAFNDLTVNGTFLVNGTTSTVNSTTVTVKDPIITLGGNTPPVSNDAKDRGVEFRYYDSVARVGFFGMDDTDGRFKYFINATNTSEVFSGVLGTAEFGSIIATTFSATSLTVSNITALGSTASVFLTHTAGLVQSRTAAQVLTDIGAQAALTNPNTGTGSVNFISKWSGSTTQTDSQIFDNGTNIGVGTSTPSFKLDIRTTDNTFGVIQQLRGGSSLGATIRYSRDGNYTWDAGIGASGTNNIPTSFFGIVEQGTTPRFVVAHTSGNVGIGTTTPSERLHVIGNATVSGTVNAGTFSKAGGTSTQFLKADGSVDSNTYLTTGSASSTYLPLTGGTITGNLIGAGTRLIQDFILDTHPESSTTIIPFIHNDIAFLNTRGGTASDNIGSSQTQLGTMFNGTPDYAIFDNTNWATTIPGGYVLDMEFHKGFPHGSKIGVSFGNVGWRSKYIKIEVFRSDTSVWETKLETSTNASPIVQVSVSTGGWNYTRARITFNDFASIGTSWFRIAQVWWLSYQSSGVSETYISRGGGVVYRPLTAYDGSASAPAYSFNGFTSTGLFKPAGVTALAASVAGTERIRIDSNGNIGIGTTSPTERLHVVGNTLLTGTITASISALGATATTFLTHTNGLIQSRTSAQVLTDIGAQAALTNPTTGTGSNNFITKWNGTTTQTNSQLFDNGTNIGIGTTVPGTKLHVNGGPALNATTTESILRLERPFNSGVSFAQGVDLAVGRGNTYPSTQLRFILDNGTNSPSNPQSTVMTLDSGGNVGIGTTTPNEKLHVVGTSTFTGNMGIGTAAHVNWALHIRSQFAWRADSSAGQAKFELYADSNEMRLMNGVRIRGYSDTAITENFNLDSSNGNAFFLGNVGVGIAVPTQKLHVVGNALLTGTITASISALGTTASTFLTHTGGLVQSRTSAQVLTDIGAQAALTNPVTGTGSTNFISKWNGTTTQTNSQIFDDGTNVGIGTVSPTEKLHVSGNAIFAGNLKLPVNSEIQIGTVWNTGTLSFLNGPTTYLRFEVTNGRIVNNLGRYLTSATAVGQFGTLDNFATVLVTNNTERARIDTSGNFGIGTSSPTERLHVSGSAIVSGTLTSNYSTNGGEVRIDTNNLRFRDTHPIQWSSTSDSNGTKDLGLRRVSAGLLEIYDGITPGTYRDLIARTVTATTIVKSGGTSSQFLKADGSVDSNTYLTTGAASGTYLPLAGGTLTGTLVTQDITINGTLLINGTTSTVNSTTVTVKDPIITLGGNTAPTSNDAKDRGVEFRYYDSVARVGFFGRDDSDGRFKYYIDATNTSEVFSGTLGTAEFGSVIATTFTGSLSGNATTATTSTNLAGGNATTLLGSIPYQSNTNITTLLPPNTLNTKRFLTMTGTGTNGAGPTWSAVNDVDVVFTDNTTGNATTGQHGYLRKLSGVTTEFLRGDGTWAVPVDTGITSLNGLTGTIQTFNTDTTGTDFNISSTSSVHTFNLPTASAVNTGKLSNTDWTTFNNKLTSVLNSTQIFVGNSSNVATAVTMSGDATLSNTGVLTIGTDKVDDGKILAHTSSKITIVNKVQLNGAIVYNDQVNTYGDFNQVFRSSRLLISNPANTFNYTIAGSAISAGRTITLPLLTGNDTLVTEAMIQTLSNKTIASPVVTGVISNAVGSESTPSYTFTGNLNTGMFQDGTNIVAFSSNGTKRLVVNTSGISVTGTATISNIAALGTTATTFLTHTAGLVQSRTSAQVLTDIGAQAALTNPVTGTGSVNFISKWNGITTQTNSQLFDNGTNIGIGTITPSGRVHISGASGGEPVLKLTNAVTGNPYLQFESGGFIQDLGSGHLRLRAGGVSGYMTLDTNSLERVRISATGDVGIGTVTPTAKLDVNGDVKVKNYLLQNIENNSITSGTQTVASTATSTYRSAFFEYVATSGTNARAGIIFAVWQGTTVEWTDTSTQDIGNTSDLQLQVVISGANVVLQSITTTGTWSVKTLIKML